MFDIAWTELLIIAVLAVIVVGPKDLPRLMRGFGAFMRKARAMAREFQIGMEEIARESEIKTLNEKVKTIDKGEVEDHVRRAFDPDGVLKDGVSTEKDAGIKPRRARTGQSAIAAAQDPEGTRFRKQQAAGKPEKAEEDKGEAEGPDSDAPGDSQNKKDGPAS